MRIQHRVWRLIALACAANLTSCYDGSGTSIKTGAAPTISGTTVSSLAPAVGSPVSFSASCSGTGTLTYAWKFGDGSTASTESAIHTYQTAGTDTPTFTCTDATGQLDVSTLPTLNVGTPQLAAVLGQTCSGKSAGQGWCWQVPSPVGKIHAIAEVSHFVLWEVGAGGTIQISHDGGTTWQFQNSTTSANLASVSAVDENTVWAAGSAAASGGANGVVVLTTDGGATWASVTSVSAPISAISAVSATQAWACTGSGQIYLTKDAGQTWSAQNVPSSFSSCRTLSAGSASGAWATGVTTSSGALNSVALTTSDAATWRQVADGSILRAVRLNDGDFSVSAVSTLEAWVCGEKEGGVYHTVDGGASWASQDSPAGEDNGCVAISVARHAIGNAPRALLTIYANNELCVSTDGGVSWGTPPVRCPFITKPPVSIAIDDANFMWVTDGSYLTSSSTGALGITSSPLVLTQGSVGAMGAADTQTAFALAGSTLRTTDGGAVWSSIGGQSGSAVAVGSVNFAWAASNTGLYSTMDGLTWGLFPGNLTGPVSDVTVAQPFDPNSSSVWVALADQITFVGIGAAHTRGTQLSTATLGLPAAIPTGGVLTVQKVRAVGTSLAWAAAGYVVGGTSYVLVLRTTDGNTWSVVASIPGTSTVTSLSPVDSNSAWLTSGAAIYLASGNGTVTQVSGTPDAVCPFPCMSHDMIVAAADATHAWVASSQGNLSMADPNSTVWYTSDGGATWHPQENYAVRASSLVALPQPGGAGTVLWLSGPDGILKTVTSGQ